uniref:Dehydroquinase class I n=1 Tax=Medicago truncatula TaxID=3880 RepID=A7UQT9_MEDTR|nr:Dehydroquinase class I [Medicago truncatula]
MQATGTDIIKLVPLIAYSIGESGLISQFLCPKFGGFFVCGSLARNPIPGLPSLHSLQEAYKLEHVNANTEVFGLISSQNQLATAKALHCIILPSDM